MVLTLPASSRRSALIVPLALPAALERVHREAVPVASMGVPAHVTILFPFRTPASIGQADIEVLHGIVAAEPAFDVRLTAVHSFAGDATSLGTVYLAPEPPEPFVRLTRAVWAAYPDHPPYEGVFGAIVPHLTVADDASRLPEVEAIASATLPIRRRVSEAWLIAERGDGRWARRARLALGPPRSGRVPAAR